MFLDTRKREEEWMDRPGVDPVELECSLRFIRRVNVLFGYTRSTIAHLARFSRGWSPGQKIRIIDFATGSADIPRAILRWSRAAGFDVEIVAIDLHPITAKIAETEAPASEADPKLQIVVADAMNAPFPDGSFDYALTAMFLHHLSADEATCVLREMDRVASRGIIAADLLRHRRAYVWITLLTAASNAMVRHDARVSVQQAFSRNEVLQLRRRASIEYAEYHRHFAHRFILAGEKGR